MIGLVTVLYFGRHVLMGTGQGIQGAHVDAQQAGNEVGATGTLRSLITAIDTYQVAQGAMPTFGQLARPPVRPDVPYITMSVRGAGLKATIDRYGYRFRLVRSPVNAQYCLEARAINGAQAYSIDVQQEVEYPRDYHIYTMTCDVLLESN
jgi:hypothetical protein